MNTAKMKADEMHEELKKFDYFSGDGVPMWKLFWRVGTCLFIPRFHCE